MDMIPTVFWGVTVLVAIALVAMIATFGTWTVQFFARNRAERLASHQPLVRYYRDLGSHAFAH